MDRTLFVVQQAVAQNARIVVGDMGERRAALHVAQRPKARRGAQVIVGNDVPRFGQLDLGLLQLQNFGVRVLAGRQHQRCGPNGVAALQRDFDAALDGFDRLSFVVANQFDAFVGQQIGDALGDIFVFAVEQMRPALHDGNARSETPKHLRKLAGDVAAAQN